MPVTLSLLSVASYEYKININSNLKSLRRFVTLLLKVRLKEVVLLFQLNLIVSGSPRSTRSRYNIFHRPRQLANILVI